MQAMVDRPEIGMNVRTTRLEDLSVVELTDLYERIRPLLAKRIEQEKRKLEAALARLSNDTASPRASERRVIAASGSHHKTRRKYPPVLPKYRNPTDRSQTWAGRGKQPRWLVSQLKAGKKIEDFLIRKAGATQSA
ncbi:H-NS family nucleoid-associated regulatory protein [Bradyrhizobium sp.]|uniref:H-NS histone family protein n=1 Tax=Bradyrhizobium sp. TaxID=376 RepID=UPI0039E57EF3